MLARGRPAQPPSRAPDGLRSRRRPCDSSPGKGGAGEGLGPPTALGCPLRLANTWRWVEGRSLRRAEFGAGKGFPGVSCRRFHLAERPFSPGERIPVAWRSTVIPGDLQPRPSMAVMVLSGLALLAGLYVWLYYNFLQAPKCRNRTSLRGKTVLITGANTGIGEKTALELARRGARVILACRNKARAETAVSNIQRESGNNEVLFMSLDLADLSSVRAFAEAFLRSEPRLDILINNAGVQAGGQSADGFNLTFQVNHLSHFLLNHLLLDRLKCCAPSRVVVVASNAHRAGKIDFQNIHKPVDGLLRYFQAYCHSKLANILYTRELANRLEGTNVTCYAVHPGLVNTELFREYHIWMKPFLFLTRPFMRNSVEGAQTSIYCATQEGIEMFSGYYFGNCKLAEPYPQARDDAVAKKLWAFSEKLLGLAE